MSEITERIQDYRAGKIPWPELRDWLAHRDYPTPERYKNLPLDPFERELHLDLSPDYTEGTWDEVARAWGSRLLTYDEYHEIVVEAQKSHNVKVKEPWGG